MIDPSAVAFDIDGVIADTMTLFLEIARETHDIGGLRYSDITSYALDECLNVPRDILDDIAHRIVDGNYAMPLKIYEGAGDVLQRIANCHGSVLLVTARPHPGPIEGWLHNNTALGADQVEIVATGSYENKTNVLLERRIAYFVEDRLETCFLLQAAGITPVVYKQPWNRKPHRFLEVDNWAALGAMIRFERYKA